MSQSSVTPCFLGLPPKYKVVFVIASEISPKLTTSPSGADSEMQVRGGGCPFFNPLSLIEEGKRFILYVYSVNTFFLLPSFVSSLYVVGTPVAISQQEKIWGGDVQGGGRKQVINSHENKFIKLGNDCKIPIITMCWKY